MIRVALSLCRLTGTCLKSRGGVIEAILDYKRKRGRTRLLHHRYNACSTAEKHMMEVHEKGKSVLVREGAEKAEFYVHQLQNYKLHATMEPAE